MRKLGFLFIALLITIAACTKKSVPTAEKVIDASSLFGKNCSKCHGTDGTNGRSPNLAKTKRDKDGLVKIITKGDGHMPAFEDKLSQKEIAALANFVFALKK